MLNSRPRVSQSSPVAAQRCATGAGLDGDPRGRGTIGSAVPVRPRQPTAYTAATHRRRVLLNIHPESPTVSAEDPKFKAISVAGGLHIFRNSCTCNMDVVATV